MNILTTRRNHLIAARFFALAADARRSALENGADREIAALHADQARVMKARAAAARNGITAPGPTDMNVMRAFHALTQIAATTHGGRPSDYNNPATWKCASAAVRTQDDMNRLMREHKECGRLRVAIAAARMTYAMRSAAIR